MNKRQTKIMAVGLGNTTTINDKHVDSKAARQSKLANILKVFYRGQSLNRFEAERHHDHVLNTTVSILQNNFGIQIDRKREKVPCLNRRAWTSVNRYWLSGTDENKKRAYALLSQWGQA